MPDPEDIIYDADEVAMEEEKKGEQASSTQGQVQDEEDCQKEEGEFSPVEGANKDIRAEKPSTL